jgi:acyl-CoA synthetase (AMP-forming)/AMP-acid ligase II
LLIDVDTPPDRRNASLRTLGSVGVWHCNQVSPAPSDFEYTPFPGSAPAQIEGAAVIKLTSGTTGAPRGIVLSPRAVAADTLAIEAAMGIGEADRVVASVPMSFSYGFGSLALPALLSGRQLVVPDLDSPLGNLTAAREFAATVLPTVPAFLGAVLKRGPDWSLEEPSFPVAGRRRRSSENFASSAVMTRPWWNMTSGRSVNV